MLTHVDEHNRPTMVDVSQKQPTHRSALAQAKILVSDSIMSLFADGEIQTKKGPVFQTAIIAGTMAAKKTSDLIPFCHPLPVESCHFEIRISGKNEIHIDCEVKTFHKTGVEMEALCGATIAALTVCDMCKALSHQIEICQTKLIKKTGGKSDYQHDGC